MSRTRSCFLFAIIIIASGCFQKHQDTSGLKIEPHELAQLKNLTQLHVLTYKSPAFLVALPTQRVRAGKLGIPLEFHGYEDAAARGRAIPAISWLGDPTVKLEEVFVTRWQLEAGLTNVSSIRRAIDNNYTGYLEGSDYVAALEIRVMEWGLYYHPQHDRYFFQLTGRARLLRPGYDNVRWAALCMRNTDPAPISEWTDENGVMLKKGLDTLVEECAGDLMRQFVSQ